MNGCLGEVGLVKSGLLWKVCRERGEEEGPWVEGDNLLPPLCLSGSLFATAVSARASSDLYKMTLEEPVTEADRRREKEEEKRKYFESPLYLNRAEFEMDRRQFRAFLSESSRLWFRQTGLWRSLANLQKSPCDQDNELYESVLGESGGEMGDEYFKLEQHLFLACLGVGYGFSTANIAIRQTIEFQSFLWILPFICLRILLFIPLVSIELFVGHFAFEGNILNASNFLNRRLTGYGIMIALLGTLLTVTQAITVAPSVGAISWFVQSPFPWEPTEQQNDLCKAYKEPQFCAAYTEYDPAYLETIHPFLTVQGITPCYWNKHQRYKEFDTTKQGVCMFNELYATLVFLYQPSMDRKKKAQNIRKGLPFHVADIPTHSELLPPKSNHVSNGFTPRNIVQESDGNRTFETRKLAEPSEEAEDEPEDLKNHTKSEVRGTGGYWGLHYIALVAVLILAPVLGVFWNLARVAHLGYLICVAMVLWCFVFMGIDLYAKTGSGRVFDVDFPRGPGWGRFILAKMPSLVADCISHSGLGVGAMYILGSRTHMHKNIFSTSKYLALFDFVLVVFHVAFVAVIIAYFGNLYSVEKAEFYSVDSRNTLFVPLFFAAMPQTLAPNALGLTSLTCNAVSYVLTYSIQIYAFFNIVSHARLIFKLPKAIVCSLIYLMLLLLAVAFMLFENKYVREDTRIAKLTTMDIPKLLSIPCMEIILVVSIGWINKARAQMEQLGSWFPLIFLFAGYFSATILATIAVLRFLAQTPATRFGIAALILFGASVWLALASCRGRFLTGEWEKRGETNLSENTLIYQTNSKHSRIYPKNSRIYRKNSRTYPKNDEIYLENTEQKSHKNHLARRSTAADGEEVKEIVSVQRTVKNVVFRRFFLSIFGILEWRFAHSDYSLVFILKNEFLERLKCVLFGNIRKTNGFFNILTTMDYDRYMTKNPLLAHKYMRSNYPFPAWIFVSVKLFAPLLLIYSTVQNFLSLKPFIFFPPNLSLFIVTYIFPISFALLTFFLPAPLQYLFAINKTFATTTVMQPIPGRAMVNPNISRLNIHRHIQVDPRISNASFPPEELLKTTQGPTRKWRYFFGLHELIPPKYLNLSLNHYPQ